MSKKKPPTENELFMGKLLENGSHLTIGQYVQIAKNLNVKVRVLVCDLGKPPAAKQQGKKP